MVRSYAAGEAAFLRVRRERYEGRLVARRRSGPYELWVSTHRQPDWQPEVVDTLRALSGEATLGDLVTVTGLFRSEVVTALESLMTAERVHVRVSESGDIVYHLDRSGWRRMRSGGRRSSRSGQVAFDRKTLRLIRAREGVLSMAELVEHTGLPLAEAELEMKRLVARYGGEAHPSWDGHVVWAFPELMSSTHGRFDVREPRPAWVRAEDPVDQARSGGGVIGRLARAVRRQGWRRFRDRRTVRRYALGHVIQTALAGKGVVSLAGTVRYLQARAGRRVVRRASVEAALRQLAEEFRAPVTEVNGDLFFGFRNVKRQFLASHVVRRHMRLGRTPSGRTVFDSADSPGMAATRDLASFDAELLAAAPYAKKIHDAAGSAD